MRALALALAATAAVAGLAVPAAANPLLDQAQRAIDDIDPQGARDLTRRALESGKLDAAELRRAHRLAGESAAAMGDGKAARDHFVRLLLLDPAASLPAGVSPKLAKPFAEARAEAERLGIALRLPRTGGPRPLSTRGAARCDWPWRGPYISYRGEVMPCCMVGTPDRAQLGSVARHGIDAVWNGADYRSFRQALESDAPPEVCRSCSIYRGVF